GPGRGLRHERAAAGDLRCPSPLVRRALPGNAAGVLLARERGRHGGLLAGGPLGAGREPLLHVFLARRGGGGLAGAGRQPTAGGALVPPLRPRRPPPDRDNAPDSVGREVSGWTGKNTGLGRRTCGSARSRASPRRFDGAVASAVRESTSPARSRGRG